MKSTLRRKASVTETATEIHGFRSRKSKEVSTCTLVQIGFDGSPEFRIEDLVERPLDRQSQQGKRQRNSQHVFPIVIADFDHGNPSLTTRGKDTRHVDSHCNGGLSHIWERPRYCVSMAILLERSRNTKTAAAPPSVGAQEGAAGEKELEGPPVPTPAADYAETTVPAGRPRRAVRWCADVVPVGLPAIFQPLSRVARHVVQAPTVGGEGTDRRRPLVVPGTAAAIAIRLVAADLLAPAVLCRRSGPGGVLPLSFARQAIPRAGLRRQPRGVGHRVVPGDVDHGTAATTPTVVVRPAAIRVACEAVVLFERHLVLRQREGCGSSS